MRSLFLFIIKLSYIQQCAVKYACLSDWPDVCECLINLLSHTVNNRSMPVVTALSCHAWKKDATLCSIAIWQQRLPWWQNQDHDVHQYAMLVSHRVGWKNCNRVVTNCCWLVVLEYPTSAPPQILDSAVLCDKNACHIDSSFCTIFASTLSSRVKCTNSIIPILSERYRCHLQWVLEALGLQWKHHLLYCSHVFYFGRFDQVHCYHEFASIVHKSNTPSYTKNNFSSPYLLEPWVMAVDMVSSRCRIQIKSNLVALPMGISVVWG